MSDWQPGDLALCVTYGTNPRDWCSGPHPKKGNIYEVKSSNNYDEDDGNPSGTYLELLGFEDEWFSKAFVKVSPNEEIDGFEETRRISVNDRQDIKAVIGGVAA